MLALFSDGILKPSRPLAFLVNQHTRTGLQLLFRVFFLSFDTFSQLLYRITLPLGQRQNPRNP